MKITLATLLAVFLAAPAYAQNIVDEIDQRDSLSSFSEAIAGTGLQETIRTSQDTTLFAPNNEAFERLPEGFQEYLTSNEELFNELVNYHIADQALTEEDIARMSTVQTNSDSPIEVKALEMNLFLNNASIVETVEADNGVLHEVDRVLIPPLLFDQEPAEEPTDGDDTGDDTDDDAEEDTNGEDTNGEEEPAPTPEEEA